MKNISSKNNISRDGACTSPWQHVAFPPAAKTVIAEEAVHDCLIIGGGITGLTAALELQIAGKQTLLVDAHSIGFGTSGGTSAHINTFADTTFKEAENAFGEEGSRLFADAIRAGFDTIKVNIDTHSISCDYESKAGYLYAETDDEVKQLADIYQGAVKVGVSVKYTNKVATPVPFKQALLFEGQAQFHPIQYLLGLRKAYLATGGTICENTLIESVKTEGGLHIANDQFKAKALIYATHLPPNINLLNFECAPYRSYVMAVKLKSAKYPDALIYDSQEPYHYVRTHVINGQQLLLAGGLDHKTGHGDAEKAFAELEKYIRKYYHISSVKYKWSSQYYVPVDGLPYIGQMPLAAKGIYCATGYNGNGMMLGSVAGKILADLVAGKVNKYEKLFSPGRIKPVDSFSEFVKENADVAYHFVADRLGVHQTDSLKRVQPGTGKVVEVDGKKVAAYRDQEGRIHALSAVCTHAACIVSWNSEEKSWDCPCHGARYNIHGQVLTGPATKALTRIELE